MPPPEHPLATLRERLLRLGLHHAGVVPLLNAERGPPDERLRHALEATDDDAPLSAAVRLFHLGVSVPSHAAASVVGPDLVAPLVEAGLLRASESGFRSAAAIAFVGELAAAQDFIAWRPEDEHDDLVTPVAGATRILMLFTVPAAGGRVLEIGTGQGLPLAAASMWARTALGTDISRRALVCAAMTAALNARANIELRHGSLFEPLRPGDDAFESIISNPPFVLSPDGASRALAGSGPGPSFTERVVRGCPSFLADGGFATVLGNWGSGSPDDWAEPVRAWTAGCGCDALVIQIRQESARAYADAWRREMRMLQPFREPARREDWLAGFEAAGVRRISFGVILLRRRAGPNWFHASSRATAGLQHSAGSQIRRWFDARTRLANAPSPPALLAQPARLCPALELSGRPALRAKGEWGLSSGTLRQTEGWPEPLAVDPMALAVLCGCDGRRPLRSVIAAVAESAGMNPGTLERALAPSIQRWFELAYLF